MYSCCCLFIPVVVPFVVCFSPFASFLLYYRGVESGGMCGMLIIPARRREKVAVIPAVSRYSPKGVEFLLFLKNVQESVRKSRISRFLGFYAGLLFMLDGVIPAQR